MATYGCPRIDLCTRFGWQKKSAAQRTFYILPTSRVSLGQARWCGSSLALLFPWSPISYYPKRRFGDLPKFHLSLRTSQPRKLARKCREASAITDQRTDRATRRLQQERSCMHRNGGQSLHRLGCRCSCIYMRSQADPKITGRSSGRLACGATVPVLAELQQRL